MTTTDKLTLSLTQEVIKAAKGKARNLFGNRKGAISLYVEMMLRQDLKLPQKGVDEA